MERCPFIYTLPKHADWFLAEYHVPAIEDEFPAAEIAVKSYISVKMEF